MTVIRGKSITAGEIENDVSQEFSPKQIASLCNAVTWADAKRRCSSLPSFTERVNAKDGGIDAEWYAEFAPGGDYPSPLLGPGWNVSQYKQRNVFAQGRDKTLTNLLSGIQGAVKDLFQRTGRRPDRYAFFVNIDLGPETPGVQKTRGKKTTSTTLGPRARIREKILKDYDRPDSVHVEVVAAGELATFLNSLPHLRSGFFVPAQFQMWKEARDAHRTVGLFGPEINLVGREDELTKLRTMIEDLSIRVIILSGPHAMGKSRLALQATEHRPTETIVALDPRSMTVSDLLALEAPEQETVVLIEDPDADAVEPLVKQALSRTGLKLLITLPTVERIPLPNFGRDSHVQYMRLSPLSEKDSRTLLAGTGARWDFGLESWVIEQAGGNPGILLLAALLGPEELRRTPATLTHAVADAFERRVRVQLGDGAIESLRLLSLLTFVGVSRSALKELELICADFGRGLPPNTVLNHLPRLEQAGIVRARGLYVEVLPPAFAHHLAASALRGRFPELIALFAALDRAARLRCVGRLQALAGDEAMRFWDELFAPHGLFRDLPTALASRELLRLAAGAEAEKVIRLVEDGLQAMSVEERRAISGDSRRQLMWTLDELLFRKRTSAVALRCLALLAEAETEDYGNNATGVFCECFNPLHPQLPLSLPERLDILRRIFSPDRSPSLGLIGVEAIRCGLKGTGAVALRPSSGRQPLDSALALTYEDARNYMDALLDLLLVAAQAPEAELARAAGAAFPWAIAQCTLHARPRAAVAHFQTATDWAFTQKAPIPIADLVDALRHVVTVLTDRRSRAGKLAAELQVCLAKVKALIKRIDHAPFAIRLKRFAAKWTRDDEDEICDSGVSPPLSPKGLRQLAREAVEHPSVLTDDLLAWLCTEEAQKTGQFFWYLGQMDSRQVWGSKIEEIGAHPYGVSAFSAYYGGLSQHERAFVSRRLDELAASREVVAEAIVGATRCLEGDLAGLKRVEILLQQRRVDAMFVEQALRYGRWISFLSADDYLPLLKAIAGPELEHAAAAIQSLYVWLYDQRVLEGSLAEFAWQCLEAAPSITSPEEYRHDCLAAALAAADMDRAFRLLEHLCRQLATRRCWNPIEADRRHPFWNLLHQVDRERALRSVFSLVLEDPSHHSHLTFDLAEVIDQESDKGVLTAFAVENAAQAEVVARSITTAKKGFWPIALTIVDTYPHHRRIEDALSNGVQQMGGVFGGAGSAHVNSCRAEVERVLNDASTPTVARPWLERLAQCFGADVEHERLSEIDTQINDRRPAAEDPRSPERLWAIALLQRLRMMDRLLQCMSKDEVLAIIRAEPRSASV